MNRDWIADLCGLTVTATLLYLAYHVIKAWVLS